MEWWQVYLWCRIDMVKELVCVFMAIGIVGSTISFLTWKVNIGYVSSYSEESTHYSEYLSYATIGENIFKKLIFITLLFSIISIAVPTQKQIATIIILPKLANSEIVQELPSDMKDLYGIAKGYLKEKLTVKED